MRDIIEFVMGKFLELFAFGLQFFVNLNRFFRHDFVRFLSATNQRKIRTLGDPSMTIGIQPDPEDHRFLFCFSFFVRHGWTLGIRKVL